MSVDVEMALHDRLQVNYPPINLGHGDDAARRRS